ncbi:MAG TPA: anthranilate phosphoribosyltransferase, partial [Candidatus Limnocylindria bacterium]|nr:anthranilate phosphoribosyltransferase [Candidatus Limnocylindria bacterium]
MSELVRAAIGRVVGGGSLTREEARLAMGEVMDGAATPAQLAGLLLALRMRTETVDELAGFAQAMRERVVRVQAPDGAIDTCGTGGDGSGTFNISTAAALVAAAAGLPVAKHGNRAVTSSTGSADVLEALGIAIDLGPADATAALARDGFCFLFAPGYHPAMRHAGPVRRELGVPTCFNLLGPLTNPAGVRRQVVGVADPSRAAQVARVLHTIGVERALVVHGDGVDELPLDGSGVMYDVSVGGVRQAHVDSATLGLLRAGRDELR